jgi:hypothetical protein
MQLDTLVTTVSLLGLGVIFFLMAYRPTDIPPPPENEQFGFTQLLGLVIIPKVLWIACAVSAVGLAFSLMNTGNEGYKQMLLTGGLTVGVATFVFLVLLLQGTKHIQLVTPILFRAIPLGLVSLYLVFK